MSIVKVIPCACGGMPEACVYRLAEDLMGAKAVCQQCGLECDEVEHVWGGEEALFMAYAEWNRMRREEPDNKPTKVCESCGGVGCQIVGEEYGPKCKVCDGRGILEVPIPGTKA